MRLEVGGDYEGAVPEVVALGVGLVRDGMVEQSGIGCGFEGGSVGNHKGLCPTRRRCRVWPVRRV